MKILYRCGHSYIGNVDAKLFSAKSSTVKRYSKSDELTGASNISDTYGPYDQ